MLIRHLNQAPLAELRTLFASLAVPGMGSISGKYRGAFVGPAWVRLGVRPALWLTGLGGWWGKELYPDGTAINLLRHRGKMGTRFPMRLYPGPSFVDGRDGLLMRYLPNHPVLWLLVEDEIRRLGEDTLLGMTHTRLPILGRLSIPFILKKQ